MASQQTGRQIICWYPRRVFTLSSKGIRVAGMMELKCQDHGVRGGISAAHYTQDQRDFALLHESVLLWLHSSGWYMLFPSDIADDILRGRPQIEHNRPSNA